MYKPGTGFKKKQQQPESTARINCRQDPKHNSAAATIAWYADMQKILLVDYAKFYSATLAPPTHAELHGTAQ
jgi:hypothetical protein